MKAFARLESETGKVDSPDKANKRTCALIISLDIELYWGMRDRIPLSVCTERLLGARAVIPKLLTRFRERDIHATWAAVGFLFFENKRDLQANLPSILPTYDNSALSPYSYLAGIGENESLDPFHYGHSLLRRIQDTRGQEIGTHTFSHYYCLESGQTTEQFAADLVAARHAANRLGIDVKSLVFPRNQFSVEACQVSKSQGLIVVRGNQRGWAYDRTALRHQTLTRRAFKFVDSCVNLSGHHDLLYQNTLKPYVPLNAHASSFLRPYRQRFAFLAPLQLKRVIDSMTHAAKTGTSFHLWWHPHNFGVDQEQNLAILDAILTVYQELRNRYGMRSLTMGEWAREQLAYLSARS